MNFKDEDYTANSDYRVFAWENIKGGTFIGTREEIISEYKLNKKGIQRVVNGATNHHKGWYPIMVISRPSPFYERMERPSSTTEIIFDK